MSRTTPIILGLALTWAALAAVPAQATFLHKDKQDAGRPGAFLDFAASARAIGMGRAFTAVADDASALYWNPAGLSNIERNDLVAMYATLAENAAFGFFGYAQPMPQVGTIGLGLVTLNSRGYTKRDDAGAVTGSADASESALMLSQGRRWPHGWATGATLKIVRQDIDAYSSTGFGVDAGALKELGPHFQAGLRVSNLIAPTTKLKNEKETFARTTTVGLGWRATPTLLVTADLIKTDNRSLTSAVGAEWRTAPGLSLRAGMNEAEMNAGLGIVVGDWNLDYAFGYGAETNGARGLDTAHRIGFHLRFGPDIHKWARSERLRAEGRLLLEHITDMMDRAGQQLTSHDRRLIERAKQVVNEEGFPNPRDLYEMQGYIRFLEGAYKSSVENLSEALTFANGNGNGLAERHQKALALLNAKERQALILQETRKLPDTFERGDLHETLRLCKKILALDPENADALVYKRDAETALAAPLKREIALAREKMGRNEHLDAMSHLSKAQAMDPENRTVQALFSEALRALRREQEWLRPNGMEENQVIDAEGSRAHYSEGLVLYVKGDLAGAKEAWAESLRLDPTNVGARNAHQRVLLDLQ